MRVSSALLASHAFGGFGAFAGARGLSVGFAGAGDVATSGIGRAATAFFAFGGAGTTFAVVADLTDETFGTITAIDARVKLATAVTIALADRVGHAMFAFADATLTGSADLVAVGIAGARLLLYAHSRGV